MRQRRLSSLLVVLATAASALLAGVSHGQEPAAQWKRSPGEGHPEAVVYLRGAVGSCVQGSTPFDEAEVELVRGPRGGSHRVVTMPVRGDGYWEGTLQIPLGLPAGDYQLAARCRSNDLAKDLGPLPFRVLYVPSCNYGVLAAQLCTAVTAVAASGFGPRESGVMSGRLRQNVPPKGYSGPCPTGQQVAHEDYSGTLRGSLRQVPVTGTIVTRLLVCSSGALRIHSASVAQGYLDLPNGGQHSSHHNLHVIVERTSETAPFKVSLLWNVGIADCVPRPEESCYSQTYQERDDCDPDRPGRCPLLGALIRHHTGMGFTVEGPWSARWSDYDALQDDDRGQTVEYSLGGSISGRWARVQLGWRDSRGASGSRGIVTAPEPGGWRIQPA